MSCSKRTCGGDWEVGTHKVPGRYGPKAGGTLGIASFLRPSFNTPLARGTVHKLRGLGSNADPVLHLNPMTSEETIGKKLHTKGIFPVLRLLLSSGYGADDSELAPAEPNSPMISDGIGPPLDRFDQAAPQLPRCKLTSTLIVEVYQRSLSVAFSCREGLASGHSSL